MPKNRIRPSIFAKLFLLSILVSACASPAARDAQDSDPPLITPTADAGSLKEKPSTPDADHPFPERIYPIVLEGDAGSVKTAEFSPDGTHVVTAHDNGTAIIWDILTGTQLVLLQGHNKSLTSAHFDAAGERVVTASLDGTARVWEVLRGDQLALLTGHDNFVNAARFDPSGERVVTASQDGTARLWDSRTGDQLAVLSGHGGPVMDAIFHPNNGQIATANGHSTVMLWDADTGEEIYVMPDSVLRGQLSNLTVHEIVFNADGSHIVSAGEDGIVNMWDTESGAQLLSIPAHGRGLTLIDLSPDGRYVVSASCFSGLVKIWDTADGSELAAFNHGSIINDLAFSTDGTSVITAGSDPAVRVWDATSGALLYILEGHTAPVFTIRLSPDSDKVVTTSGDGSARVWSLSLAAETATEEIAEAVQTDLSPDGPWLAFAGPDGLWAVNADGTGLTQVSGRDFGYDLDMQSWAASRSGHLAYITTENSHQNASLHISVFPDPKHATVIPLTVDATEPAADASPGNPALDAVKVAIQDDSFAWSPDGRWLAFSGVIEGTTTDLYVYDSVTDLVTRLTDQPTHESRPLWSQDGSVLLYTALEGANIDTGMHVQAFWQTTIDGSSRIKVREGDDQLTGWISDNKAIFYSIDTICGKKNILAVDQSHTEYSIWTGYFDRMGYDPQSGAVVVAVWEDTATSGACEVEQGSGLYLVGEQSAVPIRIVEDDVREIVWSEAAQLFFARTDYGQLAVALTGSFIDLDVPDGASGFPQVAPINQELAWQGDGLWISALTSSLDSPPRQIMKDRTRLVNWVPRGSHLLFITADALYAAPGPEFMPALASEIGAVSSAVWVMP